MRRAARLLAAAAVVLAAAGCVSFPDSSSVKQAEGVGVAEQDPPFTSVAAGPTPGADPSGIVEGFYKAMLAYPRDLDTAREFLTTRAAAAWDPDAGLTVYDDPEVLDQDETQTVTAAVAGTLDRRGTWRSASPAQAGISTTLKLKQVEGEWRITNPDDGMFMDRDSFDRYYQRFSLYFFDPSRTVLTPDPVYIGVGDAVATSLVSDLLKGPTGDLTGAVESAVPVDTTLEVAVSVSSAGVAEVPLSANVLKLSAAQRQLFAAQLAWTLRQIDDVKKISISVDGTELDIANTESPFDAALAFSGFDPAGLAGERRLFVMLDVQEKPGEPQSSDDGLNSVNAAQVSPVLGAIHSGVPDGESVAVQTSGQLAAIVRPGATSVAVGSIPSLPDNGVATWFTGTDILRPSWDALDVLWVVESNEAGSRIFAVTAEGPRRVKAPDFRDRRIIAYAVSRDGVRFAAIVADRAGRSLVIATIDRDAEDATRAEVLTPRVIANSDVNLTRLADLAWVSPTSLAVLGAEAAGDDLQPFEVAIDGSATEAMGGFLPKNLTTIAAGPSPDLPVAVGTKNGVVYVQTPDSGWLPLNEGRLLLTAPAYPG